MAQGADDSAIPVAGSIADAAKRFLGGVASNGTGERPESERNASRSAGKGNGVDDAGTIDPIQVAEKRRAGRPKLTPEQRAARAADARARASEEKDQIHLDPPEVPETLVGQISAVLYGLHIQMAMALQAPEMQLSEGESQQLAKCIANVGRYYVRFKLDGKLGAWVALITTSGMIYLPRIALARRRRAVAAPASPPAWEPPSNNPSDVPETLVN
jgi:hypothetical protein